MGMVQYIPLPAVQLPYKTLACTDSLKALQVLMNRLPPEHMHHGEGCPY